jgi:hypothetical protein
MNFDIIEQYWKTLLIKNIVNICHNKFIKKPYIENYIIKLSSIINNNILKDHIIEHLNNNDITNEELIIIINNNFELNINEKKKVRIYFLENNESTDFYNISNELILYQIKYFRFYQTITELLFDLVEEDNELYNFILIYIKNKKNEIKKYSDNNLKFHIFYYYIMDLSEQYYKIYNLLIEYKILEESLDKNEIYNLFLKNIFTNWYNIYKKDILENKVNEKIKKYNINRNILSRILCLPNL